jgi:hypothetical protein
MKAARRIAVAVPAMALAAAGVVTTSTTATAEEPPTYRCEILDTSDLPNAFGHACSAHNGATEQGPISGTFAIKNYRGMTVHCLPAGGYAELPEQVEGVYCIEA